MTEPLTEPNPQTITKPPDWLDDHTIDQIIRRTINRQLHRLHATRVDVLAWAARTDELGDLDPAAGLVTLQLVDDYATAHGHDPHPIHAAQRSQIAAAIAWAHRQSWEKQP